MQQAPQLFSTAASHRVFDLKRAAQTHNISCAVAALDACPAWVGGPVFFKCSNLLVTAELVIEGLGSGGLRRLKTKMETLKWHVVILSLLQELSSSYVL